MYVDLPDTGCNIINSSTSFYNYSTDARTRTTYYIYEGVAHAGAVATNNMGYTYSGTCLVDGDLVFKPESEVYFPFLSFCAVCFILVIIYKVIIKRLLP